MSCWLRIQSRIGTDISDELHRPSQSCWETGGNLHKFVDKDCASGLDSDVFEGYHDLMTHYRAGDKVSLFGFSRGAYTARALAEMVHKVGLVPKYNAPWSPFAYTLYLREVDDDWHTSFAKFKEESNPINISIDFLGVWDTVSSVGDVIPCTLPFTKSNTSIRVFRQALALHERWAHLHPKFYEVCGPRCNGPAVTRASWPLVPMLTCLLVVTFPVHALLSVLQCLVSSLCLSATQRHDPITIVLYFIFSRALVMYLCRSNAVSPALVLVFVLARAARQ
ncbi:hypothetical protein LXA43DRAFT_906600 [Ganoderma leucocontextum]|nr:hypothetical protein LXA43DRAFT_906600 [Ganoderma leucocontextum]